MQNASYLVLIIKYFPKMFIITSHCGLWLIQSNGKILFLSPVSAADKIVGGIFCLINPVILTFGLISI